MSNQKQTARGLTGTVWLLLVLAVIAGLLVGYRWFGKQDTRVDTEAMNPVGAQQLVRLGEATLMVEVRDDPQERALGLSYRTELGADEGMLFVFEALDSHAFWMKDMLFDLDVVWLRDGVVVDVTEGVRAPVNALGETLTFGTSEMVNGVIEVNAGWVARHGIAVGDRLELVE